MRKKVILFALTSILISLCIPASSQEVDIKCVADTEFVSDLYFHLNDTVTMPIGQAELDRVGDVLLKQPGVHKDEEGNIIYPNGRKLTPKDIELRERDAHISWQDSLLKYQQKYQQINNNGT